MRRRDFLKALAVSTLPMPAIAQSAKPKTLRMIKDQNLASIDPIWTTAPTAQELGFNVFDVLVGVDVDYAPKPQMVEGWSIEDGDKSYVFKLRDGLKFHDGEPVRSNDCIASISSWS